MNLIQPAPLRRGSEVLVVCPSDYMDQGDFERSLQVVSRWGLRVRLGQYALEREDEFKAGPAAVRAADLRRAILDPSAEAVWFGLGGYAATEIMPVFLDPEVQRTLRLRPRLFIGFSDCTLLLNAIHSIGLTSIMGPGFATLSDWAPRTQEALRSMLFGEVVLGLGPSTGWTLFHPGAASGRLLASNLETLVLSFGSVLDPLAAGDDDLILLIEDVAVSKALLLRMIDSIFLHRKAHRIKGLVFGRVTDLYEESSEYRLWSKRHSLKELLTEVSRRQGLPAVLCHSVGHEPTGAEPAYKDSHNNLPVPNGVRVLLRAHPAGCALAFAEQVTR